MKGLAASRPSATVSSVGRHGAVGDQLERVLGGLGLDHHDRDVAVGEHPPRHDHVERGALKLVVGGEGHPLAVDQRDADAADRAGERQPGELRGQRGGVDGHHVVEVIRVERHHGGDDLDLVAQALDERGAQRPVDQPAGEDGVLGRTALTPEERAGNAARGVHPLLDVHREREEVEVLSRVLTRRGRRQDHRVAVEIGDGTACRLLCEPSGLEPDRARSERAVVYDGFSCVDTLHGGPPWSVGLPRPVHRHPR